MTAKRILLAEDNSDHRRLLLRALARGRPDVDVLLASCKQEILRAVESQRFDCIVIDFNLPPDTAPEIVQQLQRLCPSTPVVVISSSEEQHIVIESFRTGMVADFVPKERAVETGNLWERIDEAIQVTRQRVAERRKTNRRLKAIQQQADTDPLTGLYNRRYASKLLESDRLANDRRGLMSVVMIDLDHFKDVNDTYGHDAGDEVLKAATQAIRGVSSPADTLIRWGGEEIVILKPSLNLPQAWTWADTLRRAIAGLSVESELGEIRFTASMGVANVPVTEFGEETICAADKALYLAKERGRNRVCTTAMVEAFELAEEVQTQADLGPREKVSEFVSRLGTRLGPVQREHIGPHGRQVARLASTLGASLGLKHDELEQLALAAEHHDLGKVGVPEALLAKPAVLTRDEKLFVDEHARFGAELLRTLGVEDRIAQLVEHHHDRFDRPEDPADRTTAILTLADAMVAMTSCRPHAPSRSIAQALAELRRERGRQFDPEVVDSAHFLDHSAALAAA